MSKMKILFVPIQDEEIDALDDFIEHMYAPGGGERLTHEQAARLMIMYVGAMFAKGSRDPQSRIPFITDKV